MDIGPKTLFYFNRFLYIIFMNKTIITFIAVSLTALPSFAQKGKVIKTVVRTPTITRTPKVKTYVPKSGYYKGVKIDVPSKINKKMLNTLDNISERVTIISLGSSYASSAPLDFLNATYKNEPLVQAEIKKAHNLIHSIHRAWTSKGYFDQEATSRLKQAIEETIVNKSLKEALLRSLEEQNLNMLITDLADYYTLPKNYIVSLNVKHLTGLNSTEAFVESATNYLLRHPHKTNFTLRQLLKHPAVSEQLKGNIQHFLQIPVISAEDVPYLKNLLAEIYGQHVRTISLSKSSPQIQKAYASHVAMRIELEKFIAQHGRMPKFNTTSLEERNLKTNIDFLLNHAQLFPTSISEIRAEIKAIAELAEKYEIHYPSQEVVLEKFEQFVKNTGRTWTRGFEPEEVSGNAKLQPVSVEEAQLHEEICYHISNDSYFYSKLQNIVRKYNSK